MAADPSEVLDGFVDRYKRGAAGAWARDQYLSGPAGERSAFGIVIGAPRQTVDGQANRGRVHAYVLEDLYRFKDGFEQ